MRQQRTELAAIEAEIAHLRSLALDALRRRWRAVFGRTPPAGLNKSLLAQMLVWRLQEHAFGGLDRESLSLLESLARRAGSPRRQLKPGTVLVRDYHGQRHTVTVAEHDSDEPSHRLIGVCGLLTYGSGGQSDAAAPHPRYPPIEGGDCASVGIAQRGNRIVL
jgi:hypothetical protein